MWNFRQTLCEWVHKASPKFMVSEAALSRISACHHRWESVFFFPFSSFLAPVFHVRNCTKLKPNVLKALYKFSHIYLNEERSVVHRAQMQINHSSLSGWTCALMDRKCPVRLKCDFSYAVINKWWCLEMFLERNSGMDSQDHISSQLSSGGHLSSSLPEIVPFQHKVTRMAVRGQKQETTISSNLFITSLIPNTLCLRLRLLHMFAASIDVNLVRAKCRLKIFPETIIWGPSIVFLWSLHEDFHIICPSFS